MKKIYCWQCCIYFYSDQLFVGGKETEDKSKTLFELLMRVSERGKRLKKNEGKWKRKKHYVKKMHEKNAINWNLSRHESSRREFGAHFDREKFSHLEQLNITNKSTRISMNKIRWEYRRTLRKQQNRNGSLFFDDCILK